VCSCALHSPVLAWSFFCYVRDSSQHPIPFGLTGFINLGMFSLFLKKLVVTKAMTTNLVDGEHILMNQTYQLLCMWKLENP
jgi:hypothetical protein